jgi:hypothetical protein
MSGVCGDGLLPVAASYISHIAINKAVWAGGVALECILAGVIFSRRIAGRFPAFAALMIFYPLRALSLFACEGRIDSGVYDSLNSVLSLLEFALQILVAGEIGWNWARGADGQRRRYGLLVAIAGAAMALAWGVAGAAAGKMAIDRLEIFVWFLMAGLFAAVMRGAEPTNLIRVAAGFAAFSVFQFVALGGRLHAWAGRNPREYLAWSYVPAVGYIGVVLFWLAALRREAGAVPGVEKVAAR